MGSETFTTQTWKLVIPKHNAEIGGFATEREAAQKANELNRRTHGNKSRHWSMRWVVRAEAA